MIINRKGYARVALLGNPSDGFHGKTIALLIRNFVATIEVWESPDVWIIADPVHDPRSFESLESLRATAAAQGYYGGLRLILATCKTFADTCRSRGIALPERNFTIRYGTDIPRQVGLGGSSAIIAATFHALMEFYGVPQSTLPLPERPNVILQVETEELSIQAGLQDRVVCVYGGLVFMDFAERLLAMQGHGDYVRLNPDLLPPLFVAWGRPAGESGKAHSPIRMLWEREDSSVRRAMAQFASYAQEGWQALQDRDFARLSELMNANFDLRRELYGDAVLGEQTLRLVQIAREHGCAAKLPGSGGAVLGIAPEGDDEWAALAEAYSGEGYFLQRAIVDRPATG